jgi:beta-lactamase class D
MLHLILLLIASVSLSCAPTASVASRSEPAATTAAARSSSVAEHGMRVVADDSLRKLLDEAGQRGTIAVLLDDEEEIRCADVPLCLTRRVPASTFKIANSLIGLESGVIADAEFTIPWDGVQREIADWNRDHTLRSAIRASAVPYYQELARRVGAERMAEWTRKLAYGNGRTGEPSQVDRFWLDGPLAISPIEQLDFLRRFARAELPVSARSYDVVRDILVLAQRADVILRGKTGWGDPHGSDELGWFVGFTEQAGRRAYVAVLLLPNTERDEQQFVSSRRALGERALEQRQRW